MKLKHTIFFFSYVTGYQVAAAPVMVVPQFSPSYRRVQLAEIIDVIKIKVDYLYYK